VSIYKRDIICTKTIFKKKEQSEKKEKRRGAESLSSLSYEKNQKSKEIFRILD